jgi:hypothetical protein
VARTFKGKRFFKAGSAKLENKGNSPVKIRHSSKSNRQIFILAILLAQIKSSVMEQIKNSKNLILGIFLIAVGAVFLMSNLDLLSLHPALFSWKTFLIGLGVVFFITDKNKSSGIIVAAIGTYFILPDLFQVNLHQGKLFWPFIIIVIGLVTVFSRNKKI